MAGKWRAAASGLTATLAATLLVPLAAAPAPAAGTGSVSLTGIGVAASEPFDSLAVTGAANTSLPVGWYLRETGTNANDAYGVSTGSSTAGDVYSFGAAAATERAFGTLQSGSLVPTLGAAFTNDTGSAITRLDIAYTGEQWRLGALASSGTPPRGPDRLDFEYSLNATSLATGTWNSVDSLDFTSPVVDGTIGLRDGNLAPNRTAISGSVDTAAIGSGATFWVRWTDHNPSGSDDGLAVDDFSLTPRVVEVGPTVVATSPADAEADVALDADISVTFSEPVDVVDPWFTVNCTKSGSHAAVATGGPTVYSLDLVEDFESDESCTVTVLAGQVTDQDTEDPPNAMEGNTVVSFTTADTTVCGDPTTVFLHDVQGNGAATPIPGQLVTVEAVVVGDYQGTGQLGGYYLQEEDVDTDADPATSEGLFVANTSFPVDLGDTVRVRGRAGETSGQTRLSSVSATSTCATGTTVTPVELSLPVAGAVADYYEPFEAMSVHIGQELTATEVFTLGRFGEVDLSVGGRLDTPTNEVAPGPLALALQDQNDRRRILLDDGSDIQNPDPVRYPQGGLSAFNTLRVGDTLPSLTGVLGFGFSRYRVQPVGPIEFVQTNPRPEAPDEVGGEVRVAAFNVLNYFNGDGAGGGFPTERGADDEAEFQRQRAKIVAAIAELDADVVGLMELENDETADQNPAIEDLVDGLNAAGDDTYDFIDTGHVGTDAIRVGILYQPARVTPVGDHAIIDSGVDPRFIDTLNRPSIAQTFEANADGARFTAVVNHLKSKGSDCNDVDDPDTGDGQGNCNITRTNAANALADWLETDPTASGDTDFILLGDMNAYAKEDPITALRDAGYVDTIDQFLAGHGYSYVFEGQSGYLDHALASADLAGQVSGVTEWHINADEPVALDYNLEFKSPGQQVTYYAPDAYRSSDHDPVLVGLDLNAPPAVDAGGPYAVVEGESVTVTAVGSDPDDDPLTYEWDLDNDGTFETEGQSATFSAATLTAPSSWTIRVRVTDPSGLSSTDEAVVDVIWDFSGFYPPIANLPKLNGVKAGRAVPVKFSLGGNQGLAILAAGSPTSTPINCTTLAPTGPAQAITVVEALSYRSNSDTYSLTWKTAKGWTGCRLLRVELVDGTVHQAAFRFSK